MKPLDHKFFGPDGLQCVFAIDDSGHTDIGYIIKQTGDRNYVITNGSVTKRCRLAQNEDEVSDLSSIAPGLCTFIIKKSNDDIEHIVYLTATRCYTTSGDNHPWHTDDPTDDTVQVIIPDLGPTVMNIGIPPGIISGLTVGDLSFDGSKICVGGNAEDGSHLYTWTSADGFVDLSGPRVNAIPGGMSYDGTIIVGTIDVGVAFVWSQSDGFINIDGCQRADAVSTSGDVVVGVTTPSSFFFPFRWTPLGGAVNLDMPDGFVAGEATSVSSDGNSVVGYILDSDFNSVFMKWTQADGMVSLGVLEGDSNGQANAISDDGNTIVGYSDHHALKWTEADGFIDLGHPDGTVTYNDANDVTPNGSRIVGTSRDDVFTVSRAWVWTQADGSVNLPPLPDSANPNFLQAFKISGDGTIVLGIGRDADNQNTVLIWKLSAPP